MSEPIACSYTLPISAQGAAAAADPFGGLYGPSGLPELEDAVQPGGLSDCYTYTGPQGMTRAQKQLIADAIEYDAQTDSFNVTLYERNRTDFRGPPTKQVINVSRDDLRDQARISGCMPGPSWPAVLSAAFAEQHDSNAADGLDHGFQRIGNFGDERNMLFALTGKFGKSELLVPASPEEALKEVIPRSIRIESDIARAYEEGRAVIISTSPEVAYTGADGKRHLVSDGLSDSHSFLLVRPPFEGPDGETYLELYNPRGHNRDPQAVAERPASDSPLIQVKLNDVINAGMNRLITGPSLDEVRSGAAVAQGPISPAPSHAGAAPAAASESETESEGGLGTLARVALQGVLGVFESHRGPPPLPRPSPPLPPPLPHAPKAQP